MLRVYQWESERGAVESILRRLRLDAADLALLRGDRADKARAVAATLEDVARRGDAALVDEARRFDDPAFSEHNLRVTPEEMRAAHARVAPDLLSALRRSIAQVREYQTKILPAAQPPLTRPGFEAGLRWTPLASAGLYIPGGKASYPSTLVMLAVPALVAGVSRLVVCTPPSPHFSDAVLATAQELGVTEMYRVGGVGAIAAMALGTDTIRPVDKILGPGNEYVQLAKRAVSGAVGVDGFLGPSEVLVLADDSADPVVIAADMLAQAEHDPGSCFLVTPSRALVDKVLAEIARQLESLPRREAVERSFRDFSAAIVCADLPTACRVSDLFAAEHVSLQVRDEPAALAMLRNAGCIFAGPMSPVAAGDYLAGPSHCLPTNTTARFASGVSVYEFLKRSSLVRYTAEGLATDASALTTLARTEGLEAHARSAEVRLRG